MKDEKAKYVLNEVAKFIRDYNRKHEQGFTNEEVVEILQHFGINTDEYSEKLGVHTAHLIGKEVLTYEYDVMLGIRLCVENRDMNSFEMD